MIGFCYQKITVFIILEEVEHEHINYIYTSQSREPKLRFFAEGTRGL